jgi:DNA-directed RNA polymerase specialized sigma24 family protein
LRGLELVDRRSSLRTRLYRIATNRCLNAAGSGRALPVGRRAVVALDGARRLLARGHWLVSMLAM